jgi:hypothetical protein
MLARMTAEKKAAQCASTARPILDALRLPE